MSGSHLISCADTNNCFDTQLCLEWIELVIEFSESLTYFFQTSQKIFKALRLYQVIISPDVQHVLKDLHRICLKGMSAVNTFLMQPCWCRQTQFRQETVYLLTFLSQGRLPEPLKASRLENQAAFSMCWK